MDINSLLCGTRRGKPKRKHLPVGSGDYAVGCMDLLTGYGTDGVFMRLFYPTNTIDNLGAENSWPKWLPGKQYAKGYLSYRQMYTTLYKAIMKRFAGDIYAPAQWCAPLHNGLVLGRHGGHVPVQVPGAGPAKQFPVLVFAHGIGSNRTTLSTLCIELASHGFVVAAIEHRDGSASATFTLEESEENNNDNNNNGDAGSRKGEREEGGPRQSWLWYTRFEDEVDFKARNAQLRQRVAEVERARDVLARLSAGEPVDDLLHLHSHLHRQFAGRLDMSRLTLMGHSFGGSTTIAAMAADTHRHFKCGIALDPWMKPLHEAVYADVQDRPLLILNSDTFGWYKNILDLMRVVDDGGDRLLLTLKETCHLTFTDFQFLLPEAPGRYLELRHKLKPRLAIHLTSRAVRAYLARYIHMDGPVPNEDVLNGGHEYIMKGHNVDLSKPVSVEWD